MIGLQGRDDAFERVVEQHRADTDADVELEAVGVGEERFVLADRLALVVEHRPAATNPARTASFWRHLRLTVGANNDLARCIANRHRPWFGLDLLLDLAAETVGIRESYAGSADRRLEQAADVGFARKRRGESRRLPGWIRFSPVGCQIIDDAGRGVVEQLAAIGPLGLARNWSISDLRQVGAEICRSS